MREESIQRKLETAEKLVLRLERLSSRQYLEYHIEVQLTKISECELEIGNIIKQGKDAAVDLPRAEASVRYWKRKLLIEQKKPKLEQLVKQVKELSAQIEQMKKGQE